MKKLILYSAMWLSAFSCNEVQPKEKKTENTPNSEKSEVSLTKAQLINAGVVLGRLKDTLVDEEIFANGMIDVPPQNFASVSAPMGGYIRSTQVLPGMEVDKGQLLAVLEHQDYIQMQQDYLQALSHYELAQKEHERQAELYKGNASSSKKLQTSDADFKSNGALVKSLEEKLRLLGIRPEKVRSGLISSKIYITSPIHGNVKSVSVSIGKYVGPADVMYEIVDNSHQHLELKIFERDILKVAEDQKILFSVPTIGTEKFEGTVYLVGKSIDNISRTITIHGHLENEDRKRLLPGMYVNAVIISSKKKTRILPEEAVILENQSSYLFKRTASDRDGDTFDKIKIKTGMKGEGWIEFIEGNVSKDDSTLVIQGAYSINAKLKNVEEE